MRDKVDEFSKILNELFGVNWETAVRKDFKLLRLSVSFKDWLWDEEGIYV